MPSPAAQPPLTREQHQVCQVVARAALHRLLADGAGAGGAKGLQTIVADGSVVGSSKCCRAQKTPQTPWHAVSQALQQQQAGSMCRQLQACPSDLLPNPSIFPPGQRALHPPAAGSAPCKTAPECVHEWRCAASPTPCGARGKHACSLQSLWSPHLLTRSFTEAAICRRCTHHCSSAASARGRPGARRDTSCPSSSTCGGSLGLSDSHCRPVSTSTADMTMTSTSARDWEEPAETTGAIWEGAGSVCMRTWMSRRS